MSTSADQHHDRGHGRAPARALYTSLGFAVEGLAPEEFYLDGKYVDDVTMGLTL
jgi:RimJ/RimL family protein N-acetyltransferase